MDENQAALLAGLAALGIIGFGAYVFVKPQDEQALCTPGTMQTLQCPDGSTIVVADCVDGQWINTGFQCGGNGGGNGGGPICQDGQVQYKSCSYGSPVVEKRCLGGQWFETGQECPEYVAIEGTVMDAKYRTIIIGATIRLQGRTHGNIYTARSSYQGKFSIYEIVGDYYDMTISAIGYLPSSSYYHDLRVPHPYLPAYDLSLYSGLTFKEPAVLQFQAYPQTFGFEGGHWCCGALTMKSRHNFPIVTGTVFDNDSPPQPMANVPINFEVHSIGDGGFFCSDQVKDGYRKLASNTDGNGSASVYYIAKTEKNMQRYYNIYVNGFQSIIGWKIVSPPIAFTSSITSTTGAWFPEKTCYGECERNFKNEEASC